jgi:hypothetical protein
LPVPFLCPEEVAKAAASCGGEVVFGDDTTKKALTWTGVPALKSVKSDFLIKSKYYTPMVVQWQVKAE